MTPYDLDGGPGPSAQPDLAAFIMARLAEDEAVARDCATLAMGAHDAASQRAYEGGWKSERAAVLIATWHPARVLAEVEAKRRIVEACRVELVPAGESVSAYDAEAYTDTLARRVLEDLASVYDSHPDYREEWKP